MDKKKNKGKNFAGRRQRIRPILDDRRIRKIDSSDLKADFDLWPSLGSRSWHETSVPAIERADFDQVVLAGMGGSGLAGEIIVDLARETGSKILFHTVKDYHLPEYCDDRTLVLGISSSGNTEETLSILSEARKKDLTEFAFGSGGRMEELSREKWRTQFIKTSMLKVPRSSLPGIFYPVLKFLTNNGLLDVSGDEVEESILAIRNVAEGVAKAGPTLKNEPLRIAQELFGRGDSLPLLYSSNRTRAVGLRARQSINENAKLHAFDGELPELCHNDIVGWDYHSTHVLRGRDRRNETSLTPLALLLRLKEDDPQELQVRFEIVEEIVKRNDGRVLEAPQMGKSYLARIISMLYILDYSSYYMAVLRGVDPLRTPSIDLLKTELAARLNYVARL